MKAIHSWACPQIVIFEMSSHNFDLIFCLLHSFSLLFARNFYQSLYNSIGNGDKRLDKTVPPCDWTWWLLPSAICLKLLTTFSNTPWIIVLIFNSLDRIISLCKFCRAIGYRNWGGISHHLAFRSYLSFSAPNNTILVFRNRLTYVSSFYRLRIFLISENVFESLAQV